MLRQKSYVLTHHLKISNPSISVRNIMSKMQKRLVLSKRVMFCKSCYLLSVIPELLLSNSHANQTNALHGFGTTHAVRFVSCIHQDSFQVRHNRVIVFLEELLEIAIQPS